MRNRFAVALAAVLIAPVASANVVVVPANVPVCPPPSYTQKNIPHVNNPDLALRHGPTPAGDLASGKCGVTELRVARGSCPTAASHFAYDIFDFETDADPPDNRVFRQELQVNALDGVPPGDRVKISELRFSSDETISFYLGHDSSGSADEAADLVVTHRACSRRCAEEEISRMDVLTGLPPTLAVPLRISWSTGRLMSLTDPPSVRWSIGIVPQYNADYRGSVTLSMGARELTFSNGIVKGSCASNESTRIRFVQPRFGDD